MAPSQWDNYSPDPTPEAEPTPKARPPQQPKQPRTPKTPPPARTLDERTIAQRKQVGKVVLVAVVTGLVVLVGWIVFAVVDNATQPGPQTAEGFQELLDDLEDERGSTEVFRAVIYPGYASIDVPFADDERSVNYYWDGGLDESSKSTSDDTAFDLATLDAGLFAEMCRDVRSLVEDPGDCYLILEHPDPSREDDTTWISAYASNEFSQSARIEYDRDGNLIEEYPPS